MLWQPMPGGHRGLPGASSTTDLAMLIAQNCLLSRSNGLCEENRCGGCTRALFGVLALESEPMDPRL